MRKTLKFWSLLLTLSMILSLCTVFGGLISFGAAAIEIDTADELRLIGRDAAYPMDGDYVLTADIDLSDKEWIPIGITSASDSNEVYFKGTFDGQGHVISGMHSGTAAAPVATTANGWGLFSWIENATIKNVAFKDVYFNVGISASNTNMALGTVCGLIAGTSTIENVAVLSGTVQDVISSHQTRVAGVAGAFTGSVGIVIKNCFNAADVVAKHSRDNAGSYAIAAGILGNPKNSAGNEVSNCFNMGKISSTGAYTGSSPTNQSFSGNIITFAGKDSATISTTLSNNMALEGLLTNGGSAVSYSKDAAATTLVNAESAKVAASFKALTDVEDGAVWGCKDGKYPMLKTFEQFALSVPGADVDDGIIRIATADQLRLIGQDAAYPLNGDYVLTADIDLSDAEWEAIGGSYTNPFTGTFDGNGHVISGMHIGTASAPKAYTTTEEWGLFAGLNNATVKNIIFENVYCNITLINTSTNCHGAFGTVCGYIQGTTTIDSVAVLSGSLNATVNHQLGIAGIAGAFTGSAGFTIKNCYNGASVCGISTYKTTGSYAIAAGIVSRPKSSASNKVINCLNVGTIYAKDGGTSTASRNMSLAAHIVNYQEAKTPTDATATARANNFAIEGLLTAEGVKGAIYTHDVEHESLTVLTKEQAKTSSNFAGLGSGWTLKDGYYPLPAALDESYAVSIQEAPLPPDPDKPIEIRTADELRKIGVDAAYPMDGNYILMADIDLSDKEWVPLGAEGEVFFSGSFDGNGHVISNLHIGTVETAKVITATSPYGYGLFAYLGTDASVSNLLFKDICININVSGRTNLAVGAVAGYTKNSGWSISNVVVLSGLISASNQRQNRVGGILGCCTSATNGATISNCYNGATLISSFTNTSGNCYAGAAGIVGFTNGKNLSVKNCLNVGIIVTPVSGLGSNRGSIGNIVAFPSVSDTIMTELLEGSVLINSFAIEGRLDYNTNSSYTAHFEADKNGVTLISNENAKLASSFKGLTDVENGTVWVCKDGEYPMLSMFEQYAMPATDTGVLPPEPAGPIEIRTEEELRKIGVDDAYPLDGDYILMADIDLTNSAAWIGIGGYTGFSGTFDGNGHVIIGMHAGSESTQYVFTNLSNDHFAWGLFPFLNAGATVKNLAFKNIYLNGSANVAYASVGAVCGYTNQNDVVIENVAVLSGSLKVSCTRQNRVGGIIGITKGGNGTLIKNCYNGADIYGTYTSTASNCYLSLGGIVGFYEGKLELNGLVNCFNAGKVVALKTSGTTNYSSVGAIAALANTSGVPSLDTAYIVNCYTLADCLDYAASAADRISRFVSDANTAKVKEIVQVVSGTALAYTGLVSAEDSAWTAQDGYLPMLTMFKDHAVAVSVDSDVEDYLKVVLSQLTINNFLVEDDVLALVKEALGFTFTVNLCKLDLVKATESADGTYKISVSFTDGVRSYSVETEGTFALPKLDYQFSTNVAGRADGVITVTDTSYTPSASYALYWGTSEGPLKGFAALAALADAMGDIKVVDAAKGILTYHTVDSTLIPEDATHLWLSVNGNLSASYEVEASRRLKASTPEYIFGMISDTHFGTTHAPAAFKAAMDLYQSATASFVVICGDITEGGAASHYKVYTDTYAANNYTVPVWVTLGNHDILPWNLSKTNGVLSVTPKQALQNVKNAFPNFANAAASNDIFKVTVGDTEKSPGCENDQMDYTMSFGDDLYIFLCVGPQQYPNEQSSPKLPEALSDDQITWIDGVLNNYYNVEKKDGQVFVVFHFYIAETGMDMLPGYGKWDAASSKKLHNVLEKYPDVIHFSGHNHFAFDDDQNIYDDSYVSIHVPTLAKGSVGSYEGYIVERYAEYVLVKGYDFGKEEYIPHAMFMISFDRTDSPVDPNPPVDPKPPVDPTPDVPPTSDLVIQGLIALAMASVSVAAVMILKKRHA